MAITLLPTKYPAGDVTDGQFLYRSLGSFWTQIFQDKNALKGYTTGMAEELIQSYYSLIETLQQYSVKEIPIFHTTRWKALVIKKSELNKAPFVFETDGAVFGTQPETDIFYANQLFRFGYSKQPSNKSAVSFTPNFELKEFSLIANRIISPSLLQIAGIDVVLKNGTLYFNNDLFDNEYIPKVKVIDSYGKIVTFTDQTGAVLEDEMIVLWIYHAKLDEQALYSNFGTLFDVTLPSTQAYKDVLRALMNLAVEGPTISALVSAFAAFANTPTIIEPVEKIEDIYSDELHTYVITDKNVYKFGVTQELNLAARKGYSVFAGDTLSQNIKLVDTVMSPTWWKTEIQSSKLAFASHVFAANNKNQLFFENANRDIVCEIVDGVRKIRFPAQGRDEDVSAFQDYINQPANQTELISKLKLSSTKTSTKLINPVDFLFENFFKSNTLLVKLDFDSSEQLSNFFKLYPLLQKYLPSHVYLLLYLKLQLPLEDLDNFNAASYIPEYPITPLSCDGAVTLTGARPGDPDTDTNYYKDYKNRLFCVSVGPYKDVLIQSIPVKKPLHDRDNLLELSVNNSSNSSSPGIRAGKLRTEIPEFVRSPGESTYRRPSTREIPAILLIDF